MAHVLTTVLDNQLKTPPSEASALTIPLPRKLWRSKNVLR